MPDKPIKTVEYLVKSSPWNPIYGFKDSVTVYEGTEVIGRFDGRAGPNAFKILKANELSVWPAHLILRNVKIGGRIYEYILPGDVCYGRLAFGSYKAEVLPENNFSHFGKCLWLNKGGDLPSFVAREWNNTHSVYYGWRPVMRAIFNHPSETDWWPGSAGCPTVIRSQWPDYIKLFLPGEEVDFVVRHNGNE